MNILLWPFKKLIGLICIDIGLILLLCKKYEKSIKFLDIAIKLKTRLAYPYNNKGLCLLMLKRPLEALPLLDNALREKPNLMVAMINKGYGYIMLKQYEEGLKEFDKILEAKRNKYAKMLAYANKSAIYCLLRDFTNALDCANKSLEIYSYPNWLGFNNRGAAYFGLGEYQKSLESFKTSLRKKRRALCYYSIASAYIMLGDYKNALKNLELFIKKSPRVYVVKEELEKLNGALEREPDNDFVKKIKVIMAGLPIVTTADLVCEAA